MNITPTDIARYLRTGSFDLPRKYIVTTEGIHAVKSHNADSVGAFQTNSYGNRRYVPGDAAVVAYKA